MRSAATPSSSIGTNVVRMGARMCSERKQNKSSYSVCPHLRNALDFGSSPGWRAAFVASYCPNRVVDIPNLSQPNPGSRRDETPCIIQKDLSSIFLVVLHPSAKLQVSLQEKGVSFHIIVRSFSTSCLCVTNASLF